MFARKKITGARGTLTTRPFKVFPYVCIYGYFDACLALSCIQLDCVVVFGPFFFLLSVWSPCYTLSRKKKTKLIRGGTGSTWERNFYMGTQNGSKNEI